MIIILILIPVSLLFAAAFLGAFFWAVRSGQYEDTRTPAMRILVDDAQVHSPATDTSSTQPGQ